MNSVELHHVSDYIKYIEALPEGYIAKQKFLYRGESRTDYDLIPSIYRQTKTEELQISKTGETKPIYNSTYLLNNTESGILQQFITEAASYIQNLSTDDRFIWVEYAQHFGVPTRLMDWTTNPLVALYFACLGEANADGKVYILNHSFYQQITDKYTRKILSKKTIKQCAAEMIWKEKEKEVFPYPVIFQPYFLDRRMSAQSSCFMVWGSNTQPLNDLVNELEREEQGKALYREKLADGSYSVVERHDTALTHLIIPHTSKLQMLRELDYMHVNQATLFPGLDGIGKSIEWRNRLQISDRNSWL